MAIIWVAFVQLLLKQRDKFCDDRIYEKVIIEIIPSFSRRQFLEAVSDPPQCEQACSHQEGLHLGDALTLSQSCMNYHV